MDPLSVRLGDDEQKAVDEHRRLQPVNKDMRTDGRNTAAAMREMLRRYGALCGYIKLEKAEWKAVRADLDRGGVLKELARMEAGLA